MLKLSVLGAGPEFIIARAGGFTCWAAYAWLIIVIGAAIAAKISIDAAAIVANNIDLPLCL